MNEICETKIKLFSYFRGKIRGKLEEILATNYILWKSNFHPMSASWKLLLETWSFLGKLCTGFPIIFFINLRRLSNFQMAYWDAEKSKTQWQKWQHKVKKLPDTLDPSAFFASFAGRPAGCIGADRDIASKWASPLATWH